MPLSQYILFRTNRFFWFNLIVFVGRYWKQLPYTLPIWILFISYTVFEIFEFKVSMAWRWPLTFDLQRSPGVKIIPNIRNPIHDFLSNFYWHFLSISYRSRDIRLQSFEGLTVTIHLQMSPEVKNIPTSRKPIYDVLSYIITSIGTCSLSRTVFEIFDFKIFRVWPWP